MDIANKFTDGEDTYHNKRTRSPEDDRSHRYNGQKQRPHNYDNYSSHSQITARYRDNNNTQGDEHQNNGYHNDNRDDSGPSKSFKSRTLRGYNWSPEDILNGPCNMHYTYIDRKRVSNLRMKDCQTFVKLATRSCWIQASWGKKSRVYRNSRIINLQCITASSKQRRHARPRTAELG
jgi:hypothetical protein